MYICLDILSNQVSLYIQIFYRICALNTIMIQTYAGKKQEINQQAVANVVSEKKNRQGTAFQFEDSRPKVIAQLKLKDAIHNSLRAQQLNAYQEMAKPRVGTDLLIQRMYEEASAPSGFPKSAQKIPGDGNVQVKGDRVDGKITEILVKKQIPVHKEAELKDPHTKHWWLLFKVNDLVWMQVDLNLNNGYRIIWGASAEAAEGIGYDSIKAPPSLTSGEIVSAVENIADEERVYYNPTPPNKEFRRYSCQDFVTKLLRKIGL